jgi:hypothetical protein
VLGACTGSEGPFKDTVVAVSVVIAVSVGDVHCECRGYSRIL